MTEIALRDAYGKKLIDLGNKYPQVVVLDADLSCSTKTGLFAKEFPERFFNMGVAEQDLMGTAAGLALMGKVPFASSFAMFATGRAWEIVRNSIAYPGLNVRICATHAGLTVGEDGASHQIIEDLAIMRAIPGMTVIAPADALETEQALEALVHFQGPAYLRLSRAKFPVIHDENYQFKIGQGNVISSGEKVALVTCGLMSGYAQRALEKLREKNINPTLVNMATIKPIDAKLLIDLAQTHDTFISIEEHNVVGGLGSAVCEVLAPLGKVKVHRLGVQDVFGQSGSMEDLLGHYQLDLPGLVQQITELV